MFTKSSRETDSTDSSHHRFVKKSEHTKPKRGLLLRRNTYHMDFRRASHFDVTNHDRTPAEESLHESYLLRKHSDIGNLYSSNVYEGQCFEKALKQLNKDKRMHAAEIDREMRLLEKRMNNLKTKSANSRLLKGKSDTFESMKSLKFYGKEVTSTLPVLSTGDTAQGKGSHLFSRAMSDASLHSDDGQASRPAISPSMPTINITVWDRNSNAIENNGNCKGGSDEDEKVADVSANDQYATVHARKKRESFFITNAVDLESCSPLISRKSKRITMESPRQRSPSPCNLSPGDKMPVNSLQNSCSPLPGSVHMSKSDNDIASINGNTLHMLHRRPRAHTISGNLVSSSRNEDLTVDHGAPVIVLPKI